MHFIPFGPKPGDSLDEIGTENAIANDAPAGSLSQKVESYFSLLILFINGQSMISNDVNR